MNCCSDEQTSASMSRALSALVSYLRGLEVSLGHPDWMSPGLSCLAWLTPAALGIFFVYKYRRNFNLNLRVPFKSP